MNANVLIVDDDEAIRDALSRHFRFLGYNVETAANGEEALESLGRRRTEVVISDIVMPIMDGIDLLRQMRGQYPMTHVVMVTGYVTLDSALACMRLGADTCVFKPLEDLTELETAVSDAVLALQHWQEKFRQLRLMESQQASLR